MENLDPIEDADLVHGVDSAPDDAPPDSTTGVPLITTSKAALDEKPCVTYMSQLKTLAPDTIVCPKCKHPGTLRTDEFGSSVIFTWVSVLIQP